MKRFFYLIFSFSLFFNTIVAAQSITFQKILSRPGTQHFQSVVQTFDDGYIVVGRNRLSFIEDWTYIVRFNKYGDTLWTKNFNREEASFLIKTKDNQFALCGLYGSLIKFDINGNILNLSSFVDDNARIYKLQQLIDSSYIMCGSYYSTGNIFPYYLKFDNNLNLILDSIYSNFFTGFFSDMIVAEGNDIVLSGNSKLTSSSLYNMFIMKLNTLGNQIWFNCDSSYFYPNTSSITKNGNSFFISGSYNDNDTYVSKFNINGIFNWLLGFDTTYMSHATGIISNSTGELVYGGWIDSGSYSKTRIRKIDSNGLNIWSKSYGVIGYNIIPNNIIETSDSGFALVGYADSISNNGYIIKVDKNGYLFPEIGINIQPNFIPDQIEIYQNYPNPFNTNTKLKFAISSKALVILKIYDLQGQEVKTLVNDILFPSEHILDLNLNDLSSGVYFYKIIINKKNKITFQKTLKLILLK